MQKMKAKGLFGNIVRFFSMQSAKATKLEPFQVERYLKEGDALMHMTTAGPSLLFEDYNQMIESVQKVQNQGDLEIYFGHGNMVKNRKWV